MRGPHTEVAVAAIGIVITAATIATVTVGETAAIVDVAIIGGTTTVIIPTTGETS